MRKLMEAVEQLDEGRVEDFMIAHELMWIKKLEQQIDRYSANNKKGTEWNEGVQWILQKIKIRNGLLETIERINEDEPCSICKGKGSEWDPYATYEGGAYRKCEACRGTGDESVRLGEPEDDSVDEANGILPSRGGPANYTDAAQGEENGPDWEYWAGGIST